MAQRSLWNEQELSKRLGLEGYRWFLEKAEPHIAACFECKGTAGISVDDKLRNEGWKSVGQETHYTKRIDCPRCYEYVQHLQEFIFCFHLNVPPSYRWCILRRLNPCQETSGVVSLERQQTILDALRANPEGSYMFFGPPHAGKTVWTTALYIENLWLHHMRDGGNRRWTNCRGRLPVWRITAKKMLDQHADYAMRRYEKDADGDSVAVDPDVTAEKIIKLRHNGVRFKLYIEEIDKIAQGLRPHKDVPIKVLVE